MTHAHVHVLLHLPLHDGARIRPPGMAVHKVYGMTIRVNISMPDELYHRIEQAKKRHEPCPSCGGQVHGPAINVSEVCREALERKLNALEV